MNQPRALLPWLAASLGAAALILAAWFGPDWVEQRRTGVEAHARRAGDRGVVAEARIIARGVVKVYDSLTDTSPDVFAGPPIGPLTGKVPCAQTASPFFRPSRRQRGVNVG